MESLIFALFLLITLIFFIYLYREHERIKSQDAIYADLKQKLASLINITSQSIESYQKSFEDLLKANEYHIRKIDHKLNEKLMEYLNESKNNLGQIRLNQADSLEILNKLKKPIRKKKTTRKKKKT